MKIQEISKRNIVFTFDDGPGWDLNIHLILGSVQTYVIDTGRGNQDMDVVQEYLTSIKNSNPIIGINTHFHWDHVWGNGHELFDRRPLIAHSGCHTLLTEYWEKDFEKNQLCAKGKVVRVLPNLLFEDMIYFPEDRVRVMYTPGHSADCISVYDEAERVLNVGDNVGDTLDELVPEIDTSSAAYTETISRYLNMNTKVVVSGHNKILGPDVFERISQMDF